MFRQTTLAFTIATLLAAASCADHQPADQAAGSASDTAQDSLQAAPKGPSPFLMKYQGSIGSQSQVELVMVNWGDGFVSGRYWLKGGEMLSTLSGELYPDLRFDIAAYTGQQQTGSFTGTLADADTLRGYFTQLPSLKGQAFELFSTRQEDPALSAWQGSWHLNDIWDNGILLVGNVGRDSLDFALSFARNNHTGSIEGRAAVRGNHAHFSRREFEDQPCRLSFQLEAGKHIALKQSSSNFECGFGAGAFAGGIYKRRKSPGAASLAIGTDAKAVFPTKELHEAFLSLTGEQLYAVFAFNMRQINMKLSLKDRIIVSGSVPGAERSNEAIVMYSENGTIWAATLLQEEGKPGPAVLYLSNDPASQRRLPPDFDSWLEAFRDYPVVFQTAPGEL